MKSSAASGTSTARKPASGAAKSAAGNNGNASKPAASTTSAAANKKKTTEKGKTNGKDTAAPPSAWGSAPPGFAVPKQPQVGFSDHHQRVLRHRALFAFRFLVGKAVEVQLDDASVYAGVLDCIDPDDFSIVLKNTRRKSESGEAFQSGSTVIFKRQQIVHLSADGVVNYNEGALGAAAVSAAARGFRTDTEISGQQHDHLFGRELQSANSWLDPKLDIGELEDPRHRSSKPGWNQFEANEKLFGVVSSYDENIYTTKLDKSKISTQQSREAERIALEIERQTSTNFHLQEERGHQNAHHDNNLDEEARYSSVDRKHANTPSSTTTRGQNAYVPPALRNSQRQTSGGKAQPKAESPAQQQPKSASTTSPPASSASPAAAPAPVSAPVVATPKPLSFSDAVTGRSSAASTKPEPKKAASPKKPAAPATTTTAQMNGKEAKAADAKPAAAAAASTSPEKKASGSSTSAATTSSSASTTKETKSTPSKDKDTKAKPATSSSENNGKAAKSSTTATPAASATPAAPAKKALNPNAKEFKFNVAAAEFTPKFAQPAAAPVATHSSPYHGAAHHHHQQHMGVHMHHQPHPGMVYPPMQEEWMYDSLVGMDEAELLPQGYMAYGMPMVPNAAVMQPHMYPQMVPQQNMRMMGGGGQRPHGGGYGYQQPPPYNPRGYYPQQNGGVPAGGMPYPGAVPVSVAPQPPLPREPTPNEVAAPPASSAGPDPSPNSPAVNPSQQSSTKASKK